MSQTSEWRTKLEIKNSLLFPTFKFLFAEGVSIWKHGKIYVFKFQKHVIIAMKVVFKHFHPNTKESPKMQL